MSNVILNFTNTYDKSKVESIRNCFWLDMDDISGTDMYCDEEAQREILGRLSELVQKDATGQAIYSGIHFIDSGNYHYMTRLFTQEIKKPYMLVFFDHHTDTKPAMFDMLSCGSWAKAVLEQDSYMQKMVMIGPPYHSMEEIPEELLHYAKAGRLICISEEELAELFLETAVSQALDNALVSNTILKKEKDTEERLPIYMSIDRDILCEDAARTNWDQGQITQAQLEYLVEYYLRGREILGIDICGLLPRVEGSVAFGAEAINEKSEEGILSCIKRVTQG